MAANSAQIEATLSLTATYSLITGAAVITDSSAWGSIGIVTPDTVKILLQIYDSTGELFYENAGWATADYSSPDLSLLDTTYTFTLPTDISGAYLQGQYLIKTKCQVFEDPDTTVVAKDFYQNVTATCNDIVISVEGGVIAGTTEVNLTDNTNYGTYTALSRTMILYPPPPSGQANQTGTNVDIIIYSGTVYTGVWTWKITSDVTFTDIDGVSTTCRLTKQDTFNVEQSQLCKVLCLVEKFRNQTLIPALRNKNSAILLQTYLLAMSEFQLARDGYICGKSQTVIDAHIEKVYELLGIDPDCDCGCDDGTSQPLLSVTTVDGTDGTDGSQILYGSGAPAGGTGAVGDTYINTANGDVYKKTGASTWTFQFAISGTAGADGVAVLHNDITNSATAGTSLEILKTYTVPANQLSTDGSYLVVKARFSTSTANTVSSTKLAAIYFNGNQVIGGTFNMVNINAFEYEVVINRFSNTVVKIKADSVVAYAVIPIVAGATMGGFASTAGLNLTTTTYPITARANSEVIGDITCENLTVTYYKK